MKLRQSIQCITCEEVLTLRVSLGHNSYHRFDFSCQGCEEPIGLGIHIDFKNVSTKFEFCENSRAIDEEGIIINLDPHFLLDESNAHTDLNFSWMQEAMAIMRHSDIPPILLKPERQGRGDIYEQLGGLDQISNTWQIVKKGWSLANKNKSSLSLRVLKKYNPPHFTAANKSIEAVTNDFLYRLTLPKAYPITDGAMNALKLAKNSFPTQFSSFVTYYKSNMMQSNMKRYFDCFSEFFDDYSEYDQVILYVKNQMETPEGHVATSYGFNKTKMFYGNAYEHFTSNIAVLACLNNIIQGREYDQFQSMDLQKYLTINKANRGNPFLDNSDLSPFLLCTDSSLRNASHHQSMHLIDKGKTIEYRSGGTGSLRTIPYSKYLEKCNQIALTMASLYLLEIELKKA
ncbi:hypothetical protein [Thalassotalea sp. Y01]|uniref:hypothetical protein n=1 Tax=Thalassotalea sp. Y01 TaxID=2729613 RepID=UPI00145E3A52|nr:hypothetical protein [Thalassotalea sp. Y01]NMP16346.1 hypothetical protein [Thalassotalea sp. Y01]